MNNVNEMVGSRGLPSVNERRLKKNRLWQLLFVVGIVIAVGASTAWFTYKGKDTLVDRSRKTSLNPAQKALVAERNFDFPPATSAASIPVSLTEKPPLPVQSLFAPNTDVKAAPELPPASPSDHMMLTSDDISSTGKKILSDLTQTAARTITSDSDDGPMQPLLQPSGTARAQAGFLGNRNFILAKGGTIECILNTKLVSTVSGMTSCTVSRDIFSDNGKVLLVEKGSTITGEYSSSLELGRERIFVLWDRIKTINGVTIQTNSPAADELGAAGIPGYIDNHWSQRIGAAMLLSLVNDTVAYKTAQESSKSGTVILPNTSSQAESLSGKILDKTINIPSSLSRNQGERVTVFVARDLDFSPVYELRTK